MKRKRNWRKGYWQKSNKIKGRRMKIKKDRENE